MAKVVLGLGASHSPMLNMEPEAWLERGRHDRKNSLLRDLSGKLAKFDDILASAPASMADEIRLDKIETRHAANQRALAGIEEALYAAKPDVLVMFGDDHKEVFHDDNMPPLAVYLGETIPYAPSGIMKWPYDPSLMTPLWYPQEKHDYPVAADIGIRIVESMMEDGFDVSTSKYYQPGQAMSHSFAFAYWRLMRRGLIPAVPIHVNTYFPPNQPTPARCYAIGKAVRRAIESLDSDLRVVVLGTGGLSHFMVDEEFDREFLDALASKEPDRIGALPRIKLNSGNSELRCWIAMAGSVDHLDMNLIDYVPCYRTLAGTGCGMAFATWT